jgi:hypothetical protein
LVAKAKSVAAQTYDPIGSYLAVAVIYLAMAYVLDAALHWLERTSRIPGFELEVCEPDPPRILVRNSSYRFSNTASPSSRSIALVRMKSVVMKASGIIL